MEVIQTAHASQQGGMGVEVGRVRGAASRGVAPLFSYEILRFPAMVRKGESPLTSCSQDRGKWDTISQAKSPSSPQKADLLEEIWSTHGSQG